MSALERLLHQNNLLILGAGLLLAVAVVLVCRRLSWRWWLGWVALGVVVAGGLLGLRTPAATLSYHQAPPPPDAAPAPEAPGQPLAAETTVLPSEFTPTTAAGIASTLAASGGKPTLVEIYADFGLS